MARDDRRRPPPRPAKPNPDTGRAPGGPIGNAGRQQDSRDAGPAGSDMVSNDPLVLNHGGGADKNVDTVPTARHRLPELAAPLMPSAGFILWSAAAYEGHASGGVDHQHAPRRAESKWTARHFDGVCACQPAAAYVQSFERWKRESHQAGLMLRELLLEQRLLVGLAESSIWQTSIDIVSVYGVPRLAGSAIKGLARSFARRWLDGGLDDVAMDADVVEALFGTPGAKGAAEFHDGWWVPGSAPRLHGTNRPLVREGVTPHHKKTLDSRGAVAATPFDNPEPVPQLAAHGRFLVAIEGAAVWADHAMDILQLALEMEGAGARTPEYGRAVLRAAENSKR